VVRAALFVVAAALVTACRTVAPVAPLSADDPLPAALLAGWQAESDARRSLRGRAHLAVDAAAGRLRGRHIVVLERPARLRVEVLGLMSQTAAVIATDGVRYEVFRVGDRSYESGEVRADLLRREAGLALAPEEAVAVLLGAPAPGVGLAPANARRTSADRVEFDLVDASGRPRQRVAFDAEERLRSFAALGDDGAARWRVSFDGYAAVGESQLPHAIVLDVAEGATHAEIELRDLELNPTLSADIFRLRALGAGEGEGG
jgi:outer membrane biogenesis lipoprotein LolB